MGYTRSDVTTSLPSLFTDAPPEIRHTHIEVTFPIGGSVGVGRSAGGLSTGMRDTAYSCVSIDSLPGQSLRGGHEATRSASTPGPVRSRFRQSWGLGTQERHSHAGQLSANSRNTDVRLRFERNVSKPVAGQRSPDVQPDGRHECAGERRAHVSGIAHNEFPTTTSIGRFEQTVFSIAVLQVQFFGAERSSRHRTLLERRASST